MAHDTIIPFLKNFPSYSQHVPCVQSVIKEQPSKELNPWNTLGFPNPQNNLAGSYLPKLVLIEMASRVSIFLPDKMPGVISKLLNRGKGTKERLQFQKHIISYPGHGDFKMINQILSKPEGVKRDNRILNKMKKVRKLLRLQGTINEVIPEVDSITLIWMANGHTHKLSVKSENGLILYNPVVGINIMALSFFH
jgi:hypothetical protein